MTAFISFSPIFTFSLLNTKPKSMKKIFLLATAALMVTGVTFANNEGKTKKKKCAKGKTCCSKDKSTAEKKSCCKDKADKTVKM
jgi:hypothetical protein